MAFAKTLKRAVKIAVAAVFSAASARAAEAQFLPTGQALTPLAAPGAKYQPLRTGVGPNPETVADGAAATAMSPDGKTLLVLTSGYNRYANADGSPATAQSTQYIFVYAVSKSGAAWRQTLSVANAYSGLAWSKDGARFYVAGGVDDNLHEYATKNGLFEEEAPAIALGHAAGIGAGVKPQAAGVALSPDGSRALVANYFNDSVSLIDLAARKVVAELDLRPGKADPAKAGVAGGEYPFAVAWRDDARVYVSAARDRELVAIDVAGGTLGVATRIPLIGEPTALLFDRAAGRLYATEDNADRVAIVDVARDALVSEPRLTLPSGLTPAGAALKGLNPNALALRRGGLLVTLGGVNALAFVDIAGAEAKISALVPTAWYPSAVALSRDGKRVFVANRKSPPGPNPKGCPPRRAFERGQPLACSGANQYIFQLEKAGLLDFPTPSPKALKTLTAAVGANLDVAAKTERDAADATMAEIRKRIKHVIFVIKENRTYDQVLGDLEIGNGDPSLAILGAPLSPNHHALARQFVTFDNFYDSGEQSSTGWTWSTAARTTDLLEKNAAPNYAGRGLAYESEGSTRNINTALPTKERRAVNPEVPDDDDVLPGPRAITSPDPDDDDRPGEGYLWNAAIEAGLTVRNYGFASDFLYGADNPNAIPPLREPFKTKTRVYVSNDRALADRSDPYYRGFDLQVPDFWRYTEWAREFDDLDQKDALPQLMLVRLGADHFGDFDHGLDGVNTVETQMADNDYALGRLIERVAKSRARDDTLIFVIEDDAQNGADHVDARRSLAFIVGPYVRHGALVSTRYTTVSMLRTIGLVLGLKPLSINDALALPMADAFDPAQAEWTYSAQASEALRATKLPIAWPKKTPQKRADAVLRCPTRTSAYWADAMAGQDFSTEDRLDTDAFNAALWTGLAGGSQPAVRRGADLREDRAALLAQAGLACP